MEDSKEIIIKTLILIDATVYMGKLLHHNKEKEAFYL